MKNYVYIYHSKQTAMPTPEALKSWGEWMGSLGSHLIDGGNPITGGKAVLRSGEVFKDGSDTIIGYSIIKAQSIEEAIELAKANPLANAPGGEVRVYETGQM